MAYLSRTEMAALLSDETPAARRNDELRILCQGTDITEAHIDRARLLISQGADVSGAVGSKSLMYASRGFSRGSVAMVSVLIEAGADVNLKPTEPYSAAFGNTSHGSSRRW